MRRRCERSWKAGTRVCIVAPEYSMHGRLGTVEFDTRPEGALIVLQDSGRRAALATNEAARWRNQGA